MGPANCWTIRSLREYGSGYLVGGVSSSFRNNPYTNVPMYLSRAEGAYLYDVTGKRYIDYFMGHGAVLLGHKHPDIQRALRKTLKNGFLAEFDSPITIECARAITEVIPCAERLRFTSSGSESTLLSMRLARGYTGKDKIVRIDGHFHGNHDYVLFNNLAQSIDRENKGDRPSRVVPNSRGVPKAIEQTVILIPWNSIEAFKKVVAESGEDIAAIIMNPIDYNNGCITTTREYLEAVNAVAHENNILVIYDEILSGFRTGISCAQGYYGVTPDICTLGKAISNGVPFSVVAGKEDIMATIVEDELPVVSGGTFSGNLMGAAATLAVLRIMKDDGFYRRLLENAHDFYRCLQNLFNDHGVAARVQYLGSNFFIYFGMTEPVVTYRQFMDIDWNFTRHFFRRCIEEGLYFHTDYTVSAAHTKRDFDMTLHIIEKVLRGMKKESIERRGRQ